jgi:hypothetical protein
MSPDRKRFPRTEPLLDAESRAKLPALYSQEEKGLDAIAQVKFFTPDSNWTWYASEGSEIEANQYSDALEGDKDFLCFGLVSGFEVELGYFSLKELEEVHGPLGLPIERDKHYEPKTLRQLQELHRRGNTDGDIDLPY